MQVADWTKIRYTKSGIFFAIIMAYAKGGDLIKIVAKQTKLSLRRTKEVIKKAGLTDATAYPSRALTKGKQNQLIRNLPGVIARSGYKVRGLKDPYRFRQNLKKGLTPGAAESSPKKEQTDANKPRESAADFLQKIRQSPPPSEADNPAARAPGPATLVSGSALARQRAPSQPPATEPKPVRFERVSLSDSTANLETTAKEPQSPEPIAPDIG